MKDSLHRLELVALLPATGSTAVFLRGDEHTFLIQIDPVQGQLIECYRQGVARPRPLTHDLIGSILQGFGGSVRRVVIHDVREEVFLAQLRVESADELGRRLVVDLDCRPSDGLVLAQLLDAPLYATGHLLNQVEDVASLLEQLQHNQIEQLLQDEADEPEDDSLFSDFEDEDEGDDDEDEDDFPSF